MAGKLGSGPKVTPRPKAKPAGTRGDGKPLTTSDNERTAMDFEEAQALSFVGKIKKLQNEKAELMKPVDAKTEEINNTFATARNAGFPRKLLTEIIADLAVKGQRKDLTEAEKKRKRIRTYFALPTGDSDEQTSLTPDMKTENDWRADGYRAGLNAEDAKPPSECSPRFHQAWMESWHDGQKKMFLGSKMAANPPPTPAPTSATETAPAPEPTIADERLAEQRQIAAAREGLEKIGEKIGDEIVDEDPLGVGESEADPHVEQQAEDYRTGEEGADNFEMSEEERARQRVPGTPVDHSDEAV